MIPFLREVVGVVRQLSEQLRRMVEVLQGAADRQARPSGAAGLRRIRSETHGLAEKAVGRAPLGPRFRSPSPEASSAIRRRASCSRATANPRTASPPPTSCVYL